LIEGVVSRAGLPVVVLQIAGRDWTAMVDTGFNEDVELPAALAAHLNRVTSAEPALAWLAGLPSLRTSSK
jgi:hypothetical protein